jgi:fumarylacetoacetase
MHALWCKHLYPQTAVHLALPCDTRDYTDFYCGIHHASAVGKLFRPNQPLLPNYLHLPIAYHGRSSTLIASGTPCVRPHGQLKSAEQERPFLGPSAKLDFELEIGVMIATPNLNHHPIPIEQAEDHVLGLTLVNDWSARDIQVWEYQPLGPFLAKNFATTVSPWVITLEALAPFRTERMALARSHAPLPYLEHTLADAQVAFEISLSVWMSSIAMRDRGLAPHLIAQTDFSQSAFWSIAQMIAHHTINGCQLSAGDLLATGTLSGPLPGQTGSLIELTQDGRAPFGLPDGSPRTFLEDGDQVRFQGRCDRAGFRSIGFGVCEGEISPARTDILRKH